MELKQQRARRPTEIDEGLNRTFYGIETPQRIQTKKQTLVLIVPFMELKLTKPPKM